MVNLMNSWFIPSRFQYKLENNRVEIDLAKIREEYPSLGSIGLALSFYILNSEGKQISRLQYLTFLDKESYANNPSYVLQYDFLQL